MIHPLEQQIATLRGRVRRLVLVYGTGTVVAASLGAVVVLGLGDYLIHFQDRGIRVICWLAALGVAVWSGYRFLVRPLAARLHDAELARRLQERFPPLGDRLLSAVEFLGQREDDPTAGSAMLRRTVIAEVTSEAGRLDFGEVLDRRRPVRAVLAMLAVGLVAAVAAALDPAGSRIAAARLFDPFCDVAWPQTTHLVLRHEIDRVARGQPLEIEVVDAQGARLPDEVRIHWRFEEAGGKSIESVERMQLLGGAMVARRENVTHRLEFRAEGGDDRSMPWMPVEVIEPPAVQSLAINLFPPEYTGWPPQEIDSGGSFRALVGTRVRMRGVATKPLRAAALCLEGGRQVPAVVEEDGLHFIIGNEGTGVRGQGSGVKAPGLRPGGQGTGVKSSSPLPPGEGPGVRAFVIDKSGAYWFQLTDLDGLTAGSDARSEIVAIPDQPPTVTIERPASDLFVTPQAVVPLHATARDDLVLREVRLAADFLGPAPGAWHVGLYKGPDRAPRRPAEDRAAEAEPGDRRAIDYRWELGELKLAPGTQVVFHVEAADYRPQTGKSEPRRLSVITPDELQERMAARQNLLLAELDRALRLQRDDRQQIDALGIRVRETGGLGQIDVDHLQAAELGQRQVGRNLTSRHDGVAMHLAALLADLENNRLDNPDFERRARSLLAEIERLGAGPLPLVGRELTAAIKSAQIRLAEKTKPGTPDAATAASLSRALKGQDDVIASLEAMLGQLRTWDDSRRFHRDVAQLLREQEELVRGTAEVGRETLTKELKDLSPQETASLRILASRQLELARRLDRIQQEMEQAAAALRESDPLAADTLSDALDEARRLAIGAAMRAAGAGLQENRIGQAAETHKQIVAGLQDVLDILANRRQQELARLVKKLRAVEDELKSICQRQEGLRKKMEAAGRGANREQSREELRALGRQQKELQQETERLARRLERLLAEEAGRAAGKAAAEMGRAAEDAARGDAAAAKGAETAEKSLDDAARQLAGRRLRAQAELAMEQLARLEDALKNVHRQQQNALEETRRLDALGRQGPLSRAQASSLRDLTLLEQAIRAETARLAGVMAAAGGFHLVLAAAESDMGRAAALLDRRQTGAATQEAQQNALARLDLILKALEPEKPGAQPDGDGGGDGDGKPGEQPGGVQALAEIKILKLLQEDINIRTGKLQKAVDAAGKATDEHRPLYDRLSEDQGRLADVVYGLLPPAQPGAKDHPLVEIARQMREVQDRLSHNDSGLETQRVESQIVSDLDQLIEQAKQQGRPRPGAKPKGDTPRAPIGPPNQPPAPKPGSKDGGGSNPTGSNAEAKGKRKPGEDAAELLPRLLKPGSGIELPENVRQRMLELPAEEILPKYEVLTEEYFRRLSEPKNRRGYER